MLLPPLDTPLLVVAAALIDADGRVLVQQRPAGKPLAELWEFPGGKVEAGEAPEAALVRELAEELGVGVVASDLAPVGFASEPQGERHLLLLLYLARQWHGEPEARHASKLQWAEVAKLRDLAMPAPDVPLIDLLERLI
jgi:8-oxo-dGTP diphosphatase